MYPDKELLLKRKEMVNAQLEVLLLQKKDIQKNIELLCIELEIIANLNNIHDKQPKDITTEGIDYG